MDNLTHSLVGALIGAATAPRHAPAGEAKLVSRMVVGAVAANLPDLDVLVSFFVDEFAALNLHRGATHSAVLLPVWSVLVAAWVARVPRAGLDFRAALPLAALALLSHVALDALTAYGTRLLVPLDDRAFAWPTVFIIDLWFTGLVAAGLALAAWRRSPGLALAALAAAAGYLGMLGLQASHATGIARLEARADERVSALPQPGSPRRWRLVLESAAGYRIAHLDLGARAVAAQPEDDAGALERLAAGYRPRDELVWQLVPRWGFRSDEVAFAREAWARPELAEFRRFAGHPALAAVGERDGERCAVFSDLRFRLPTLDRDPFRAELCARRDGGWRLLRPRD